MIVWALCNFRQERLLTEREMGKTASKTHTGPDINEREAIKNFYVGKKTVARRWDLKPIQARGSLGTPSPSKKGYCP